MNVWLNQNAASPGNRGGGAAADLPPFVAASCLLVVTRVLTAYALSKPIWVAKPRGRAHSALNRIGTAIVKRHGKNTGQKQGLCIG